MKKIWDKMGWTARGIVIASMAFVGSMLWVLGDVYIFEDGSIFTTIASEGDAVQRIEAQGEDFRVYEFTPETAPHIQCVFAVATNKGGLVCFPKRPQEETKVPIQ